MKRCQRPARISYSHYDASSCSGGYDNSYRDRYGGGSVVPFSPNAPPPLVSPVSPRSSPYVEAPQECHLNLRTGTVTCLNQQRAYLDGYPQFYEPRQGGFGYGGGYGSPQQAPSGPYGGQPGYVPGYRNPAYNNYMYGSEIVDERADSPLNRVLTRGPVGPWNLIGYVQTENPDHTSSRDRTMMVYAQRVDQGRNLYNYRATDSNGVPLDVGHRVQWKMGGETLLIPGQSDRFKLHLYESYR